MSKTTKKSTNKKRKFLVGVSVVIFNVLFLTTAAYAWFSLTNAPSVHNLVLKAGTSGELLISNERDGEYSDSITLEIDGESCLRPLTTINGTTFYRPIYGSNGIVERVSGTAVTDSEMESMINAVESEGGWLIKKTFYLKSSASDLKEIDVRLMAPIPNRESGTVITNAAEDTNAAEAIRISFTYNGVTAVVEPLADVVTKEADPNQAKLAGWDNMSVIKQSSGNNFSADGGRTYTQSVSDKLFDIPTNEPAEVTMYIWLEGADRDCVNAIMGNTINVELRFISEEIK